MPRDWVYWLERDCSHMDAWLERRLRELAPEPKRRAPGEPWPGVKAPSRTGYREADKCGARRKRDGQPCEARALRNGRCRFHGGLSTGPRTPEGRARALACLKQNRSNQAS